MIEKSDVKKASRGDRSAMEKIYKEYCQFVWNVALKTCGNRELASDAAQEVFIKIFKKLGKFKFKSSLRTWVYRITVNTTLNLLDREKRRQGLELRGSRLDSKESSGNLQARQQVEELLSLLKNDERMLIVLREMEGLSYKEMASATSMNISTVKTKIYRAREKLRKAYRKQLD